MKLEIYSYRFAEEITQHPRHLNAWNEIHTILRDAPLFIYPNKSSKNKKLDVVQQLMNTYFERVMVIEHGWDEETKIVDVSVCQFSDIKEITGKGNSDNQWRIVHGYLSGTPMNAIGFSSPTGPVLSGPSDDEAES